MQKVSVLSLDAWSQLSEEEQDVSFFCESFFSTKTSYLRPIYSTLLIAAFFFFLETSSENKMKRIHLYSYSSQKRSEPSELNESSEPGELTPSKAAHTQTPSKTKRNSASTSTLSSTSTSNKAASQKRKGKQTENEAFLQMDQAKEHLMLSFVPEHILCREAERADIYNYLHNSILQKGNGSPLYISGRFLKQD